MQDEDMDVGSGMEPDLEPDLDEFLLARIAEDKRVAVDAASDIGRGPGSAEDAPADGEPQSARAHFLARFGPAHVLAECAAKRRVVLACREALPDMSFLGSRARGLADFPLTPGDEHQLAALTLAQLAVPYADHHDYRAAWRP
jgi:hypothetical protein